MAINIQYRLYHILVNQSLAINPKSVNSIRTLITSTIKSEQSKSLG